MSPPPRLPVASQSFSLRPISITQAFIQLPVMPLTSPLHRSSRFHPTAWGIFITHQPLFNSSPNYLWYHYHLSYTQLSVVSSSFPQLPVVSPSPLFHPTTCVCVVVMESKLLSFSTSRSIRAGLGKDRKPVVICCRSERSQEGQKVKGQRSRVLGLLNVIRESKVVWMGKRGTFWKWSALVCIAFIYR